MGGANRRPKSDASRRYASAGLRLEKNRPRKTSCQDRPGERLEKQAPTRPGADGDDSDQKTHQTGGPRGRGRTCLFRPRQNPPGRAHYPNHLRVRQKGPAKRKSTTPRRRLRRAGPRNAVRARMHDRGRGRLSPNHPLGRLRRRTRVRTHEISRATPQEQCGPAEQRAEKIEACAKHRRLPTGSLPRMSTTCLPLDAKKSPRAAPLAFAKNLSRRACEKPRDA